MVPLQSNGPNDVQSQSFEGTCTSEAGAFGISLSVGSRLQAKELRVGKSPCSAHGLMTFPLAPLVVSNPVLWFLAFRISRGHKSDTTLDGHSRSASGTGPKPGAARHGSTCADPFAALQAPLPSRRVRTHKFNHLTQGCSKQDWPIPGLPHKRLDRSCAGRSCTSQYCRPERLG